MRNGTVDGLNVNPRRCLTVELLTGETISVPYQVKTTCNAICSVIWKELVARGVVYPQIFGLAIKSGVDWVFVDPSAKLSKYYPNLCKDGKHGHNQQCAAGPASDGNKPAFYCRVHFYLDAIPQNLDVVSLHHYYLQLRQNLISAPRYPTTSVVEPLAYALQFELGDWRPGQELPRWITTQPSVSSLAHALTRFHQTLSGLAKESARLYFVRAVMPQYNMHLYAMTLKTKEDKYAPAWIGVTPKGIEVYQDGVGSNNGVPAQPKLTFLWANITKLYFERKKYGIHGRAFPWANSTQKLSFTAPNESVPQHLLHLCRSTHQFHLSNHKILTSTEGSVNGAKGSTSSTGGESSCSSTMLSSSSRDDKMLDLSLWADGLLLTGESSEHQRVSVISNASSNTTSGIVSDRVYSLDGSEAEDLELREMPDCCMNSRGAHCSNQNHDQNSTSLESLSPPQRPHHNTNPNLARIHFHSHNHASSAEPVCNGALSNERQCGEDAEAKYWYCDSDCEDCDDAGHCRSMLVRTIGDKSGSNNKCAGHCECNSCVTEVQEQEDVCDGHGKHHHFHHNTPSMASEATLKAVDFECLDGTMKGESISVGKPEASENNKSDKVQINHSGIEGNNEGHGEIEEYKLDDEHVYGEISEDPEPVNGEGAGGIRSNNKSKDKMKTEDEQYSIIENDDNEARAGNESKKEVMKPPKPKPRYTCMKTVEPQKQWGCKCRVKEKCCSSRKPCRREIRTEAGCSNKECKKCPSSSSSSNANIVPGAKENGLTPKVASLKCLRKVKPPSCATNIRRNMSNKQRGEIDFAELPPVNYPDFGEKLQQGRYPSTRTVSDNFDTDSDYVQLPPMGWHRHHDHPPPRPPPKKPNSLKIWKCVTKNATGKPKQASPPSLSPPVNISTLPRRKTTDHSCDEDNSRSTRNNGCSKGNLISSKVSSRSTNALNLMGHAKPEPPPKPRKSLADLTSIGKEEGAPVDARFIATKPQILIQTAYATDAPIPIPSQAQVLLRGNPKALGNNVNAHTMAMSMSATPILKHSQSVDNIYDTVASEEPFVPVPCATPPPYPAKTSAAPLIIRSNNYIDVHSSAVKNKLSLSTKPPMAVGNHYHAHPLSHYPSAAGALPGKNVAGIGNRSGSVPNNLNNFLIGLQNLKPLSRTPIVHPAATSCIALNNGRSNSTGGNTSGNGGRLPLSIPPTNSAPGSNQRFTNVYTNQLTRSQIQQFKAQLYSDLDYVIFPPKDPRVSQQEYFDSKYASIPAPSATTSSSNPILTASAYSINDIPPPYLPPPPPYPSTSSSSLSNPNPVPPPLPKKNPKLSARPTSNHNSSANVTSSLSNHSIAATITTSPYHHNSFQSLYHPGSTTSQYSSSQYGYYTATAASAGLNSENLQRYLSTQSFTGSTTSSAPIYYASSTQSAPPLPPYKPSNHVIIENGMRKAVQQIMSSRNSAGAGLTASDERLRMNMKLCKSEESLYSQPTNEAEEHFQAIYNLPPPPPYKKPSTPPQTNFGTKQETLSSAELDLAHLRAKCHALELPLLRALCSEGELLNKNTSTKDIMQAARNRLRPSVQVHAKISGPRNPLPIPPKPNASSQSSTSNVK